MSKYEIDEIDDEVNLCDIDEKVRLNSNTWGCGILKLQSSNSMANSVPSSFVHKENKLLIAKGEIKQEHKSLFLAELRECWSSRNKSMISKSISNSKCDKTGKHIEEKRAKFASTSGESRKTSFGSFGVKKDKLSYTDVQKMTPVAKSITPQKITHIERNKSLLKRPSLSKSNKKSPSNRSRSKFSKAKSKFCSNQYESMKCKIPQNDTKSILYLSVNINSNKIRSPELVSKHRISHNIICDPKEFSFGDKH